MTAITLMIQGTTSDAGKSAIVTGLCRLLSRQGYRVAPFKPQNMALNSAVTATGGEMGRAQAVQAQACGLEPHTDMNPILLKPSSDTGAQVIINGKVKAQMTAVQYHAYKQTAMQFVLAAHQRLSQQYDIILVEGAGSPAEINLRANDIANMGFAEAVDCPVLLVADIDRGGVFASLLGTLELLSDSERQRTKGLIINRFRGDVALLTSGVEWLEKRTAKPVLGVVPYLKDLYLEAEDSLNIDMRAQHSDSASLNIIVVRLPHLSNHTDFDALQQHPQVNFQYVPLDSNIIPTADLIIIPGSKNVPADLKKLMHSHWLTHIYRHVRYGGKVLGICGGYQMLGGVVSDLDGIEGWKGCRDALNLLPIVTRFQSEKTLKKRQGLLHLNGKTVPVSGYEIHSGVSGIGSMDTEYIDQDSTVLLDPLLYYPEYNTQGEVIDGTVSQGGHLDRQAKKYQRYISSDNKQTVDGAISKDGRIIGTYLHGIFDQIEACNSLLEWAGLTDPNTESHFERQERGINQLADCLENSLDMQTVFDLIDKKR